MIRRRSIAIMLAGWLALPPAGIAAPPDRVLRVCADPNNLPFSNRAGEGLENKIVRLVAADLGATVRYTWWAQRRGFVRHTLKAAQCDVWPGIATGVDTVATTRPYYRSTYVFVTRADRHLDIRSFDDPRLRRLVVGIPLIGDDAMNPPPAHALARRGIVGNVRGYMVYGDYSRPNPPAALIDAVARGAVDVAIAWGPLAGFFAARQPVALTVTPVRPLFDGPQGLMMFDISMGVRREDTALRQDIDAALDRHRAEVEAILDAYHVPRAPRAGADPAG